MSAGTTILARFDQAGRLAEDAVLVLILTGMILLAASQIVLRNFLNIGFIWGDELLRLLVLWIAVAGAVAASRTDKHINIAILDRFLPGRAAITSKAVVHLFTAIVCGLVTRYSIDFVRTSYEFGDVLLGGVPAWLLQAVLPVGFGLISYRYFLFTISELVSLFRGEPEQ